MAKAKLKAVATPETWMDFFNLVSIGGGLYAGVVAIDPDTARELLESGDVNRKIMHKRVNDYRNDMRLGNWLLTGDAVIIDDQDRLVDGQHRLSACATLGKDFTTVVVWGVKSEAQKVMDTGAKRTVAQQWQMKGVENAGVLYAAVNIVHRWREGLPITHQTGVNAIAAEEILKLYPNLHKSVERVRKRPPYIQPAALAALYTMVSATRPTCADAFLEAMLTGAGLTVGDPLLEARERLARMHARQQHVRSWHQQLILIAAWNAFVSGNRFQTEWQKVQVGKNNKGFPEIR